MVINGKGNKQRVIQFAPETIDVIDSYVKRDRKDGCDRLFTSNMGNPIGRQCTGDMLKRTAKRAGIENWHDISNHYMRAAFATIALNNGVGLDIIQECMGHDSVQTTRIYAKTDASRKRDAMSRVYF